MHFLNKDTTTETILNQNTILLIYDFKIINDYISKNKNVQLLEQLIQTHGYSMYSSELYKAYLECTGDRSVYQVILSTPMSNLQDFYSDISGNNYNIGNYNSGNNINSGNYNINFNSGGTFNIGNHNISNIGNNTNYNNNTNLNTIYQNSLHVYNLISKKMNYKDLIEIEMRNLLKLDERSLFMRINYVYRYLLYWDYKNEELYFMYSQYLINNCGNNVNENVYNSVYNSGAYNGVDNVDNNICGNNVHENNNIDNINVDNNLNNDNIDNITDNNNTNIDNNFNIFSYYNSQLYIKRLLEEGMRNTININYKIYFYNLYGYNSFIESFISEGNVNSNNNNNSIYKNSIDINNKSIDNKKNYNINSVYNNNSVYKNIDNSIYNNNICINNNNIDINNNIINNNNTIINNNTNTNNTSFHTTNNKIINTFFNISTLKEKNNNLILSSYLKHTLIKKGLSFFRLEFIKYKKYLLDTSFKYVCDLEKVYSNDKQTILNIYLEGISFTNSRLLKQELIKFLLNLNDIQNGRVYAEKFDCLYLVDEYVNKYSLVVDKISREDNLINKFCREFNYIKMCDHVLCKFDYDMLVEIMSGVMC